jgi:signal peptidase I
LAWQPVVPPRDDAEGLPPFATGQDAPNVRFAKELPILLLCAAVIAFLIRALLAQAFYIPSGSMIPTLELQDRVVVSKLSYRLHDPRRGDVVVFECPPSAPGGCPGDPKRPFPVNALHWVGERVGVVQPSTEDYIKRVIAFPGETVEGANGSVYVNGLRLDEPYLPPGTVTSDFEPQTVPETGLWVMGDNRANSSDSRVFGPIARDTVIGRAILRVWPLGRTGFL